MGLTHLSLFSGIGGLDLAAEWAGIRTAGQCEWAEYPARVLEKHWPSVPRWKDIRTLTKESFYERTGLQTADIISGGFPCQPFSIAGKRRGTEDDRWLWPEMVRVIKELRPHWVVGENVAGIVKMALPDILSELEAEGYRTRTFLVPACAVGARHRRYRTAIVGCAEHNGLSSTAFTGSIDKACGGGKERQAEAGKPAGAGQSPGCTDVADSKSKRLQGVRPCGEQVCGTRQKKWEPERCGYVRRPTGRGRDVRRNRQFTEIEEAGSGWNDNGIGTNEHEPGKRRPAQSGLGGMADGIPGRLDGYWDIEPDIPRIANNIPHRCDRIKALGNAVVPQQFYPVFKAIADIDAGKCV